MSPSASASASTLTVAAAPQATAKAKTVALPRTARAVGVVEAWKVAGPADIAEVAPEVGSVKSGTVALGIDAPAVRKTTNAAWVTAEVAPKTKYTFEAHVRVMSKTRITVPASFRLGTKTVKLPKLDAAWKKVTGTYITGADETSLRVAVRLSKPVRGLSVDAVKVFASNDASKKNVVPNGSFERVDVQRGIVSSSLIAATKTAAVAVALPAGRTVWEVRRGSKRVATGKVTMKGALTALPLKGVAQGLYTLRVTASDSKKITTSIAIVDSPNPWLYKDSRFGVGLHVEDQSLYADAARHVRALGVGNARNDIRWERTEKVKGRYDFSLYEEPIAKLQAQGLGVLGIVDYGNPIYGAKNADAPTTKTGISAYGKYAAAIAKRFDLVGLEVFNEFNWPDHNKSSCLSAKCYLQLVKSVDKAVAKVDPRLPIVAGATAKYPAKWFDDLWKRGGLKYANAASFHPYEITGHPEDVAGIVKKSRTSMKKFGKTTKPVWITELGTSSAKGNRTPTEQASVLARAATAAFAGGAKKFYWYNLVNNGTDAKAHYDNFGLYAHPAKGVAALPPKAAAFAQALTVTQLGGRGFRSSERLGTGVVSHGFGSKNNLVRVVWAPKGKKTATLKTTKSVVLVTFDGTKKTLKPKKGVVKFTVTKNPVFVRSGSATAGVTK